MKSRTKANPPAPAGSAPVRAARRDAALSEHAAWLAKHTPAEQAVLERQTRRLSRRRGSWGDLCEATDGQCAIWRREGMPLAEYFLRACLRDPALFAYMEWTRGEATREVDALRGDLRRPLYYERENERRRALAAERRKVRRRTTTSPCPTREALLAAWARARESHEAALRFGSMLEDLECYIDNSLRFGPDGAIVGRNPGIKGWLGENAPELAEKYTTVMRYKAAAKKLRQVVGLADPIPAAAVLAADPSETHERDYVADESAAKAESPNGGGVAEPRMCGDAETARGGANAEVAHSRAAAEPAPDVAVVRARALWLEVSGSAARSKTALMDRIDALLDPRMVDDANMLAAWRAKYEREITLRTKRRWWSRLWKMSG